MNAVDYRNIELKEKMRYLMLEVVWKKTFQGFVFSNFELGT